MDAEQIAKHRQKFWEELVAACKACIMGPPVTEKEMEYLMSTVRDEDIISDIEHGLSHFYTIQEILYYYTY